MENNEIALKVIDKLEGHITDLSAKFVEIGEKYGPDVINLGLDVVRLSGAAPLFLGVLAVIALPLLAWSCRHWIRKFSAAEYREQDVYLWGIIPSIIGIFVASVASLVTLLNFWNWVAVFYPVAFLARKMMDL